MTEKTKKEIVLQPSHLNVYNFIAKFVEKNIYSPELNEIAKGIKMTERQTFNLINELCTLGFLSKIPNKKRGLKILKKIV